MRARRCCNSSSWTSVEIVRGDMFAVGGIDLHNSSADVFAGDFLSVAATFLAEAINVAISNLKHMLGTWSGLWRDLFSFTDNFVVSRLAENITMVGISEVFTRYQSIL